MINIYLFLSFIYISTFLVGKLIEKIRVPWIFASLIIGFFLAIYNPFAYITSSKTFTFLAQLGMYFLLFIIGLEINLKELKKSTKFILGSAIFIILFEGLCGMVLIKFLFNLDWLISFLVGLSFATVGEAILIPILDEFKLVNSKLGQAIIGIGTMDDIIEVFTLILVAILIGSQIHQNINIGLILISLLILFSLTIGLRKLKEEGIKFKFHSIETLFLFTIFILFLFLGFGEYAEATALASLLAGIALKTFLPEKRLQLIESEIKTICYGFFAPIFFLWVGVAMDINYLTKYPILVLLVLAITGGAKFLASYIASFKKFGKKNSILLGVGLSVRFSTSIVIIKILFDSNLIDINLYSIIVATTIVYTFLVPILFSNLLARWKDLSFKIRSI